MKQKKKKKNEYDFELFRRKFVSKTVYYKKPGKV